MAERPSMGQPPGRPGRVPEALAARLAGVPGRRTVVRYAGPTPIEQTCYGCEAILLAWAPAADLPATVRRAADGTVIREVPYLYRPTAAWAQVLLDLELEPGVHARYLLACCRTCAAGLTVESAEAMVLTSLETMAAEDEAVGVPAETTHGVLARLARARVRGIEAVLAPGGLP